MPKTHTIWTEEQDALLKELHGKASFEEIGARMNKTAEAARGRAIKLIKEGKLQRLISDWTKEEDALLIQFYGTASYVEIGKQIGRSAMSIKGRVDRLAKAGILSKKSVSWRKEEDAFIKDNYGVIPPKEIAKQLLRTLSSVHTRANILGVTKRRVPVEWTQEQIDFVLKNYGKMMISRIAKVVDKEARYIRSLAKDHGLTYCFKNNPRQSDGKYLGTLCLNGHDWNNTGKSLKLRGGCLQCKKERQLKNKEEFKKYGVEYRQKVKHTEHYKQLRKIISAKYQAKKKNVHSYYVPSNFWEKRAKEFNKCCAYCRSPLKIGQKGEIHLDHFIPLSEGGSNVEGNFLVTCATCNKSKGASDPYLWFSSQPFFKQSQWKKILKVLGKTHANYNQIPLL